MTVTKLAVISVLHATSVRGGFCSPDVWKQIEGCELEEKSGTVVGKLLSSRTDDFSADGVEIQVEIHGERRTFSPRNLLDCQIFWLGSASGFPSDLATRVVAYEQNIIFDRARRQFRSRLEGWYDTFGACIRETCIQAPVVDGSDCALTLHWANRSVPDEDLSPQIVASVLGFYEGPRLISARVAELAAIEYYEKLGSDVVDVSIRQLAGENEFWKDFDLFVDQRPIDIKNARRSFSSRRAYSEYCVPRFKLDRSTRREVTITGVLSEYMGEDRVGQKMGGHCVILGEVRKSEITKLLYWMNRKFGAVLDFEGLWQESYQPGWVFDYPAKHYAAIEEVKDQIASLLDDFLQNGGAPEHIPGILLLLSSNGARARELSPTALHRQIIDELTSLRADCGLSRPALYLYITGRFLSAIVSGEDGKALSEALQDMLFFENDLPEDASVEHPYEGSDYAFLVRAIPRPWNYPAGLIDPMAYIHTLVNSLASAAGVAHAMGLKFRSFRMTHPEVIRGLTSEGKWISVIAYCGGWRRKPTKVRCGQSPLCLGNNMVCRLCGFLICDACGFCTNGCYACEPRQAEVAHSEQFSPF